MLPPFQSFVNFRDLNSEKSNNKNKINQEIKIFNYFFPLSLAKRQGKFIVVQCKSHDL